MQIHRIIKKYIISLKQKMMSAFNFPGENIGSGVLCGNENL